MSVIGYLPPPVGMPVKVAVPLPRFRKLTPGGSVPLRARVVRATGLPAVVTVNSS